MNFFLGAPCNERKREFEWDWWANFCGRGVLVAGFVGGGGVWPGD